MSKPRSQPRQMALRFKAGRKLQTRKEFERVAGTLGSKGKALRALLEERRKDKINE